MDVQHRGPPVAGAHAAAVLSAGRHCTRDISIHYLDEQRLRRPGLPAGVCSPHAAAQNTPAGSPGGGRKCFGCVLTWTGRGLSVVLAVGGEKLRAELEDRNV